MMKFIKLPVVEVAFSKEKLKDIFKPPTKDPDEPDWEALGITPPEGYQEEDDDLKSIGFIETKDEDFIEKIRRIRVDLIEDYGNSTVKMKGKNVTLVNYAGDTCFTPMTADELDVYLKDENNYIVL